MDNSFDKYNIDFTEVIPWKDEYAVGIELIDRHHQELFEIINTLGTHFAQVASKDIFLTFLNILIDYTSEHFSTEEDLIYEFNPEQYKSHKMEHEAFVKKIYKTLEQESSVDTKHREELIVFLKKWLVLHILEEDIPALKPN
ncbi:MAG: bacteriohemerythrin [Lachnospirales bacterium]